MKKKMILLFIILTSMVFASYYINKKDGSYKVLKVTDGDTFYLDFNRNGFADKDEKIRINGIDTFETKVNDGLLRQMKFYGLTKQEALALGYLAKRYAEHKLLNKYADVEFSANKKYDKYDRSLVSIYYDCKKDPVIRKHGIMTLNFVAKDEYCKSYEKEILKEGLAKLYFKSDKAEYLKPYYNDENYEKQLKKARKLNLVFYDYVNKKYRDIDDKTMEGYSRNNLLIKTARTKISN